MPFDQSQVTHQQDQSKDHTYQTKAWIGDFLPWAQAQL